MMIMVRIDLPGVAVGLGFCRRCPNAARRKPCRYRIGIPPYQYYYILYRIFVDEVPRGTESLFLIRILYFMPISA